MIAVSKTSSRRPTKEPGSVVRFWLCSMASSESLRAYCLILYSILRCCGNAGGYHVTLESAPLKTHPAGVEKDVRDGDKGT